MVSCYYIYISTCSFSNNNCELINVCTISFKESESVSQPNIWHKYILDNFFNKFTLNSKTINYKNMEINSDCVTKTLWLEHKIETVKKPVILNKIQSDSIKTLISECEYYKNKTSSLEVQLLNTKIAYLDLVKDINDIVKEMNDSTRKS